MSKGDRRADYFTRVHQYFKTYKKILLIGVDNVGSSQMHQIRAAIRGQAVLLMGKNTMIKKAMREIVEEVPEIETLISQIKGNIGLVFTNGDLKAVRDIIIDNKVAAPAKVGAYVQCDVHVPVGNTGIAPDKTSFFQNLGIPTKVVKGAIEVVSEILLLKKGGRVGASESELLTMLNITPFAYGCVMKMVYENGDIYEADMLDITDETILKKYADGLKTIAALSLRLNIPTVAAVPHSVINGYKNLLAVSLSSDFTFPAAEKLKQMLANPSAFARPAQEAQASKAAPAAPVKEEKKEESDEEMGLGLFD